MQIDAYRGTCLAAGAATLVGCVLAKQVAVRLTLAGLSTLSVVAAAVHEVAVETPPPPPPTQVPKTPPPPPPLPKELEDLLPPNHSFPRIEEPPPLNQPLPAAVLLGPDFIAVQTENQHRGGGLRTWLIRIGEKGLEFVKKKRTYQVRDPDDMRSLLAGETMMEPGGWGNRRGATFMIKLAAKEPNEQQP